MRIAVLIVGTCREIEFILDLFPHMAGDVPHDIFLVLRHVNGDRSRLGNVELDFRLADVMQHAGDNVFAYELPAIDQDYLLDEKLIPVGPTDSARECGMISMLHGVFLGVAAIKGAGRRYTHVMKTRTDYLPWIGPWLSGLHAEYLEKGERTLIDDVVTRAVRYPDRPDIHWQGSISDLFSYSSYQQFLQLWDFAATFDSVWTGIPETTLFRAVIRRLLNDDVQSPRRNETFMRKHFVWTRNEEKQSAHMLRHGVLSGEIKTRILDMLQSGANPAKMNKVIRSAYDYITTTDDHDNRLRTAIQDDGFIQLCKNCRGNAEPI